MRKRGFLDELAQLGKLELVEPSDDLQKRKALLSR